MHAHMTCHLRDIEAKLTCLKMSSKAAKCFTCKTHDMLLSGMDQNACGCMSVGLYCSIAKSVVIDLTQTNRGIQPEN